ncbi:MAG: thiamine phosphate synthase [Carboxylicivirga sp.]|jgi:thiamine-phosphate pyrophosphorylase|nr:thiamine phosphate synthase [Carboxylicivirga sp.]
MKQCDVSLYLVTDRELSLGRSHQFIVEEAVKGGVTMVQLREKDISTHDFYQLAKELKKVLTPLNVPLIINDRLDIALAVDADGLHIGQSDMPYEVARQLMGADKIIGLSVETIEQAREANQLDVDYIGLSPVFSTMTKTDINTPLGLEGIKEIASFTKHKTVAIGGINTDNAGDIIKNGADGIAVVSAIVSQENPCLAAQKLKDCLDEAKNIQSKA